MNAKVHSGGRGLPKTISVVVCMLLVGTSLVPSRGHAATGVPRIINNQGRLMNSSGTLLGGAGTDYCFKFSLYDNATVGAGSKMWPTAAPSTMTVVVKNGVYNVGIGDTVAGGDTLDFNFEDTDGAFLNVEVATKVGATCAPGDGAETFETLSPRQRLYASGYAINAATVGGYLASPSATGNQIPVLNGGHLYLGGTNPFINATSTNALTFQGGGILGDIQFFSSANKITAAGNATFAGSVTAASANFTTATATDLAVTGIASTSNLIISNGFTFKNVTGILKATAGVVAAALVDLANDVTGILGIINGGTGTSTAPSYGRLLVGNAVGGYDLLATSSLGILGTFSTTSADFYADASSTIPKTYTANTFNSLQTFDGGVDTDTLTISGNATTTAGNGIDIASGCFSVAGECVTGQGGGGGSGVLLNIQTFTTNDTYVPSAGATNAQVIVTGGGAGGGGADGPAADTTNETVAGGGGAGGTSIALIDLTSITSVNVIVGGGGGGGTNAGGSGSIGQDSAFGTHATGTGGAIGGGTGQTNATGCAAAGAIGTPGAGGTATAGDVNVTGGSGYSGSCLAEITIGGEGGASYWGGGGRGGTDPTANGCSAGITGAAYGSGGGGASCEDSDTGATGGSGAGGVVVVYEYGPYAGVMGIDDGGTGTTTAPTYGQLLVGNGVGGYTYFATSSLGILGTFSTTSADNYASASTTIAKTYTANVFTALQTFGSASTSNISSTYASSTQGFFGALSVGSFSGILKATAGAIASAFVDLATDVTGILGIANGGTGTSTPPTYGKLLVGNAAGGYDYLATSTLGFISTNVAEGTNLYYTDARVNTFVGASTTVPKTFTANVFSALQTFGNASTTNISSTYASSTGGFFGSLSVGSLSGVLRATAGALSAGLVDLASEVTGFLGVANGGTGTSTAPTYGRILVGNAVGGYDLRATSTLAIAIADTIGTLSETRGGTNQTSYTTGDILYASGANTLAKLAIGGAGQVLKIVGGVPQWGTDNTGSGGAGYFATTTDSLALYPTDTSQTLILGTNATTSQNSKLEVVGKSYFSDVVGIATTSPGSILSIGGVANFSALGSTFYSMLTLGNFVATSTLTVGGNTTLANASSTAISGTDYIAVGRTATTTIRGESNATSTFAGGVQARAINLIGNATSTAVNGVDLADGCYAIDGVCTVSSVAAGNGSLTVSPNQGAVTLSLNLSNANIWTGLQRFSNATTSIMESVTQYARSITSTSTNALIIQTSLSSTAGLTLGSTSTPQMFALNTVNNRVTIGTGGGSPIIFVLDTKNTPGDPTGIDGGEYYNSNTSEYRCYSGAAWRTCGGIAASSTGDVQFRNTDGSFTATANLNWSLANNGLTIKGNPGQTTDLFTVASSTGDAVFGVNGSGVLGLATTTDPTAPSSGLDIYAKQIAGRVVPKWMGPAGVDTPFQAAIWQNHLAYFTPGAAAGLWQGTVGSNLGTAAIVLPSVTNFFTNQRRSRFSSVVTTLNQQVGTRSEAMFFRGNAAGQGGFFFAARVGFDTWTANNRMFVGFSSGTTAVCTGNPTALANTVGFGINSGSTTIAFIHNDAAGVATETVIPGQPALATNQGYALYIFAKPNDTVVYWQMDDVNTGLKVADGRVNTNLPVNTTMLVAHACMSNGSNTALNAAQLGINRLYIETDR